MSLEFSFSPNTATQRNIEHLQREQLLLEERRLCELYELTDAMSDAVTELYSMGMSPEEAFSILSESLNGGVCRTERYGITKCEQYILPYVDTLSAYDKIIVSRLLCERLSDKGYALLESDFLLSGTAAETFVYVKNAYADEAYDVFSQDFADPRVSYVQSFKEALSSVALGRASYALLPIEEGYSRLPTVSEMIFNGDFKIASITPVLGFDGLANMKYAMISTGFLISGVMADDDRYLEIRIPTDSDTDVSYALLAARAYGIDVYRINTSVYETDEGRRSYFDVIFKCTGKDYSCLLSYLTLFTSEFTAVGMYKNIE